MTHKEARISKGFARQQCGVFFADEFGLSICKAEYRPLTISDGITTAEMAYHRGDL